MGTVGSYTVGDSCMIKRINQTITFWKNGSLLYTSSTLTTGSAMIADVAFYNEYTAFEIGTPLFMLATQATGTLNNMITSNNVTPVLTNIVGLVSSPAPCSPTSCCVTDYNIFSASGLAVVNPTAISPYYGVKVNQGSYPYFPTSTPVQVSLTMSMPSGVSYTPFSPVNINCATVPSGGLVLNEMVTMTASPALTGLAYATIYPTVNGSSNGNGLSITLVPNPTTTSISPSTFSAGSTVTVNGNNLYFSSIGIMPQLVVTVSGTEYTIVANSATLTSAIFTIPSILKASQSGWAYVKTAGGGSTLQSSLAIYFNGPQPTITSVSPSSAWNYNINCRY